MKLRREKIERAADAIKFLVPLDGFVVGESGRIIGWTEKGLRVTKWPRGFTKIERKLIRLIAKTALEA